MAEIWYTLRNLFNDWGVAINKVWLIGENLSPYLFLTSSRCYTAWIRWNNIAGDWLDIYNWLQENVTPSSAAGLLAHWADDLVSLVRYFNEWVEWALDRYWPMLLQFARNPGGVLVSLLLSHTGFDRSFIYNPRGIVQALIDGTLGGVRYLLDNPARFIIEVLQSYFPNLAIILQDPDGWLVDRLQRLVPNLSDFIRDPDGFIFERLRRFIESRIDSVSGILSNLATRILEYLW